MSASGGASPVTVTLNAAVTWRLDFAAGTERTVANLRGGRVAGISITAGSDIVDLTLSLDGAAHAGVAGGTVFATPGRTAGAPGTGGSPGFDVDAAAGVSRVAVTRWGG